MGERLKLNSVSGNVVSFDTDLEKNLGSLKIGIEPVQEGSGDPSPDNVRAITGWTGINIKSSKRNLIPYPYTDNSGIQQNGITFTYDSNGIITANGTATANAEFSIMRSVNLDVPLSPGTYILSGLPTGAGLSSFVYDTYATDIEGKLAWDRRLLSDFTISVTKPIIRITIKIRIISGYTVNNIKFYPQLELGSAATPYEPYVGTTYPITFPSAAGTVYGGTLDVTKGTLTVDRAYIGLNTVAKWSSDALNAAGYIRFIQAIPNKANGKYLYCDALPVKQSAILSDATDEGISGYNTNSSVYIAINASRLSGDLSTSTGRNDSFKNYLANNPINIVYELATPQTYSLTPTEISTLLGANTLYADCGPIQEASYFSRDYVPATSDTGLITITDGVEAPIDSLKIHFEPIQEGSGDPSPENVRAISGWSGVNVWRNSKNFIDFSAPILPPDNINGGTAQKRKFTPGAWVKGVAHNNYYDPTRGNVTIYNDHVVINSRAGYGAGFALALPQGETFYINAEISLPNYRIYAVMYASDGTHMGYKLCMFQSSNMEYTVPNGCAITVFEFLTFDSEETGVDCTVSNIQIEHNSTTTSYEPYTGQTYPITFPSEAGTVYGGYVDVAKGELVANKVGINVGSLNYSKDAAGYFQTAPSELTLNDAKHHASSTKTDILCSQYKTMTVVQVTDNDNTIGMYWYASGNRNILRIRDNRFLDSTASEFKQAMDGIMLVYPLSEPITYSLTPTQLSTIKGLNNIYSDANGAIEMSYYSPVKENMIATRRSVVASAPHTETASGSVASFNTNMTAKLKNLTVDIEPIQEGSGDPSPENVRPISGWTGANIIRCGKNALDLSWMLLPTGTLENGVLTDSLINLSTNFIPYTNYHSRIYISITAKRNGETATGRGLIIKVYYDDDSKEEIISFGNSTIDYSTKTAITQIGKKVAGLRITYGTDGVTQWSIKDVIVTVDSTDTLYEPYIGTIYPIVFPAEAGTVYGGTLDVTTGELTVDRVMITPTNVAGVSLHPSTGLRFWVITSALQSINLDANNNNKFMSNMFIPAIGVVSGHFYVTANGKTLVVVPFADQQSIDNINDASSWIANSGAYFVYPLATPQTYHLAPTEVQTLLGANNIYADTGNTNLTYWKH